MSNETIAKRVEETKGKTGKGHPNKHLPSPHPLTGRRGQPRKKG